MEPVIDLIELVKTEYSYPTWSTDTSYKLKAEIIDKDKILIYYESEKTIMKKMFKETFPRYINLTPGFCWALGFFEGEGLKSKKYTSYRRFNITNKNPRDLKKFLNELDKSGLLPKERIRGKCFQIHHFLNREEVVIEYWSKQLDFPKERFSAKDYNHNLKREGNGVCHFDIGHVLLRRIFDLINEKLIAEE